ncbi:hypothetical protein ACFLU8_04715 [Chloroflexota bacterium]
MLVWMWPRIAWTWRSAGDDAVWWDIDDEQWEELRYPDDDYFTGVIGDSADLAFVITGPPLHHLLLHPVNHLPQVTQ